MNKNKQIIEWLVYLAYALFFTVVFFLVKGMGEWSVPKGIIYATMVSGAIYFHMCRIERSSIDQNEGRDTALMAFLKKENTNPIAFGVSAICAFLLGILSVKLSSTVLFLIALIPFAAAISLINVLFIEKNRAKHIGRWRVVFICEIAVGAALIYWYMYCFHYVLNL
ncbi:MAG: hypothetical protein K6G60_09415 [Lachnospiraceae bacterium]|nr:hypothetical protein [Lachnospiraceae bacterium]